MSKSYVLWAPDVCQLEGIIPAADFELSAEMTRFPTASYINRYPVTFSPLAGDILNVNTVPAPSCRTQSRANGWCIKLRTPGFSRLNVGPDGLGTTRIACAGALRTIT